MYESVTYERLLNRMMQTALSCNSNLDTREGSLVWLGNAPGAVELQNLYIQLDTVLNETFADTASREFLIRRAAERGLSPYPATSAVLELSIKPVSLELPLHTRFSVGTLTYFVSENRGTGKYAITCESVGEEGNSYTEPVVPVEYIRGLESCTITALLIPGENEEEMEEFRQRYFRSLETQAFGGNAADYVEKVSAIPGVGGVKVFRAWNGDIRPAELIPPETAAAWISGLSNVPEEVQAWLNTVFAAASEKKLATGGCVKLTIIDSTYSCPSAELIKQVQETVDPQEETGEGLGLAPIGHVVRVTGVQEEKVNISACLTYQDGWAWEDVKEYAEETIAAYFHELAKSWANQKENLVVRISQLESKLLDVTGILDVMDTQINGTSDNAVLQTDHIPILGEIAVQTWSQGE